MGIKAGRVKVYARFVEAKSSSTALRPSTGTRIAVTIRGQIVRYGLRVKERLDMREDRTQVSRGIGATPRRVAKIVVVALGIAAFGAAGLSGALAQQDDGIFGDDWPFPSGGSGIFGDDWPFPSGGSGGSGGDINVGGSTGSNITMGGSGGGISIGGGNSGSGSGGGSGNNSGSGGGYD